MKTSVNAREFSGKAVIGIRGWRIGRVKDVVLNMKTWEVQALDVILAKRVADEFGLRQTLKSARIPINVQDVQGMGDAAITLKVTKEQLRGLLAPRRGARAADRPKAPGTPEGAKGSGG